MQGPAKVFQMLARRYLNPSHEMKVCEDENGVQVTMDEVVLTHTDMQMIKDTAQVLAAEDDIDDQY